MGKGSDPHKSYQYILSLFMTKELLQLNKNLLKYWIMILPALLKQQFVLHQFSPSINNLKYSGYPNTRLVQIWSNQGNKFDSDEWNFYVSIGWLAQLTTSTSHVITLIIFYELNALTFGDVIDQTQNIEKPSYQASSMPLNWRRARST